MNTSFVRVTHIHFERRTQERKLKTHTHTNIHTQLAAKRSINLYIYFLPIISAIKIRMKKFAKKPQK